MKKFGRQAQYYHDSNNYILNEKDNTLYDNDSFNNINFDYEDPVDFEFIKELAQKSNYKSNTKIKKEEVEEEKETYKTPKFNSCSSSYKKNNNTSTNIRYIRLSELDDNNPYNCLDVSQLATQDEIRKAYKKLILINHPDKGGDAEKFNKIHEAYEMLSNPVTKNIIDTFGSMSLDLAKSILMNDILSSKQLVDDINFCIKQNDYTQLYFIVNNMRN